MGRLPNGVGRRYPVTIRRVSLIAVSMMQACTLATPDRCTVLCCRAHKGQGSCLKNSFIGTPSRASSLIRVTRQISFPRSDSQCPNVINLSSFTPGCVGIWVKDRHFLSSETLSLRPASLLFRWKAADTIFDQLSFSHQIWRYAANVTRSWLRTLSTTMHN